MKTKELLSPEQEAIIENILLIVDMNAHIGFDSSQSENIPIEVIIAKCAEAWGIPKQHLKSRIDHGNEFEKKSKYSLLFACSFFNSLKSTEDIEQLMDYPHSRKERGFYCVFGHIKYQWRYWKQMFSFMESLIDLAPDRFRAMVKYAEAEKKKGEAAQRNHTSASNYYVNECLKMAEDNAKFYYDLLMQELKRPNRVGVLLNQPLIGPSVTNWMKTLWQSGPIDKGSYVDRLDKNRIYEFEEVERDFIHIYNNFDKDLERFLDIRRS